MRNQSGQGLTEYLTILVLVSILAIAAVTTLGSRIREKIQIAGKRIHSGITFAQ